jgi:hypothetical protein
LLRSGVGLLYFLSLDGVKEWLTINAFTLLF